MATNIITRPAITHYTVDVFFEAYASRVNDALSGKGADIDATVNAFAACFVEASPLGVICGKNDQAFRDAIPKGSAFYRETGMKAMVIEARELTVLNEQHALVKIHWRSDHLTKEGKEISIPFEVIYLLQQQDHGLKVFAYITGDEKGAMKDAGVLPDSQ